MGMLEEWKPITGYPGYEVSNQGRVRSVDRVIPFRSWTRTEKGKIFSPVVNSTNGYLRVALRKDRVKKLVYVHQLVAKEFLQRNEGEDFIDHINTIRTDNRVENLRWVTAKGNSNNPITIERQFHTTRNKRVIQLRYNMSFVAEYESAKEAARLTGISHSHICETCKGIRRSAGGFIWQYKK